MMSNHRRKESQNNTHGSARVRHLRVRIEQEEYDLRGIEARGFRELASKAILPAIRPELLWQKYHIKQISVLLEDAHQAPAHKEFQFESRNGNGVRTVSMSGGAAVAIGKG